MPQVTDDLPEAAAAADTSSADAEADVGAGVADTATDDAAATDDAVVTGRQRRKHTLSLSLLAVWGPGLIVMLADTDAGSLFTAAQSGSQFGYAMVLPAIVLIPILYMVQEMTVRLGVVTGKGHGELIRTHFGTRWAMVSALTLMLATVGALLTEFAGVAGVGQLFGISKWVTVPVATAVLIVVALFYRYRRVERIGIAFGLAELAFIPAMVLAHPHASALLHGLGSMPLHDSSYVTLLAANVGAVIMPWMIFYQQGAVIDKGLTPAQLRKERHDTATGSVISQVVMIVVIVAMAATIYRTHRGAALNTVSQIAGALSAAIGSDTAKILVGVTFLGAAVVAALVVSLAGAWGMSEVLGWRHSLNEPLSRHNAHFYGLYAVGLILGAALVLASVDLVRLAIDVEVMNALLLPIVLGFLVALEARVLPPEYRMHGTHRVIVTTVCFALMAFGLYMIPSALGL
jgi:Mn2+/Fe2+ NRAMP family transporter